MNMNFNLKKHTTELQERFDGESERARQLSSSLQQMESQKNKFSNLYHNLEKRFNQLEEQSLSNLNDLKREKDQAISIFESKERSAVGEKEQIELKLEHVINDESAIPSMRTSSFYGLQI